MNESIAIAGDLYISDKYQGRGLFGESVRSLLQACTYSVANLEAPVLKDHQKALEICKDGPSLKMGEWVLDEIKAAGLTHVSLANNHILDYGFPGLEATLNSCSARGIQHFGAGLDSATARAPLFCELGEKVVGLISICENEWSTMDATGAGAASLDLIDNFYSIRGVKEKVDFLIVVAHGGNEHYHLPSPRVKKWMRYLVEVGADAVVMHHSHRMSGMEIYKGCPIFYGLGNFVFTAIDQPEGWYSGAIAKFNVSSGHELCWDVEFVSFNSDKNTVDVLTGEYKDEARRRFDEYSRVIVDDALLLLEWNRFIDSYRQFYLQVLSPVNIVPVSVVRSIFRRLRLAKYLLPKRHLALFINFLRCESHLDVSKEVLTALLKDKK